MNIDKECKNKIAEMSVKHDLKLVVLYGSQAKNCANINSDVDIAVMGNKEVAFNVIIELNNDFSDIFKVKEVDVKSLHGVDAFFRYEVMSNSVLLFGNEDDYDGFRAYAFRDYCDSRSLLVLKLKIINKRIADLKTIS